MTGHLAPARRPCPAAMAKIAPPETEEPPIPRTHPPLDPELAAVLAVVHDHLSPTITAEDIEDLRANPMFAVPDEALTRNGTVHLQNLSAPGPPGAPDISLLVLKPVG
ncbi:hypothetical protein [Streptomyces malaysiensis]|uniref:hypothetical protein n=1 Tax=Streptomyces malaysiensis TaxID=92644 RepID=UPI0036793C57